MHRHGLRWILALSTLGLFAFIVALGANLLPGWEMAAKRDITAQLTLTWLMIGSTSLTALTLAVFLLAQSRIGRG